MQTSRTMQKGILAGLIIVIILMGLAPFCIGLIFKRHYFELIGLMNNKMDIETTVLEYHTGWLHSSAKLNIKLKTLSSKNSILIQQDITHGPLLFDTVKNGLTLGAAKMQSSIYATDTNRLININSFVGFLGHWINQVNIPALNYEASQNVKVTWQGLYGHVNFDTDYRTIKKINTDLSIGDVSLLNNEKPLFTYSLSMTGSRYSDQAIQKVPHIWDGNIHFTSSKLIMNTALMLVYNANLELDQLSIDTLFAKTNEQFYNLRADILLNKLQLHNEKIPDISSVNFSTSINNLNVQGIKELNKLAGIKSTQDVNKLLALITPSMTLNHAISFNTALGGALVKSTSYWPANTALPTNFQDLRDKMTMNVQIKVAAPLVNFFITELDDAIQTANKVPLKTSPAKTKYLEWLTTWIKQGFIIQKDNDYLVSVTREDNIIKLNGHVYNQ